MFLDHLAAARPLDVVSFKNPALTVGAYNFGVMTDTKRNAGSLVSADLGVLLRQAGAKCTYAMLTRRSVSADASFSWVSTIDTDVC